MPHLVAVGGSDAGIAAALRARELDPTVEVSVILADEYPNFSICGIPYWISGDVPAMADLAHRTRQDLHDSGVNLLTSTTATDVDVTGLRLSLHQADGREHALAYDHLLIATGASPALPPHIDLTAPGLHRLHTMADARDVMTTVEQAQPRTAVVVGAGYIGLEMVEALHARGIEVTIVQRGPTVLPTLDPNLSALITDELGRRDVRVLTSTTIESVTPEPGGAHLVTGSPTVRDASGRVTALPADLVLLATGVRPNTELAVKDGASLGPRGAVLVDEHMRTGIPGVWAAGDCVATHHRLLGTTWLPLGTTAHKQGRVAGENMVGGDRRFGGSVGTQVVKVFDLVAARTGLRDHETTGLAGTVPLTVTTVADDHKAYYPGAVPLSVAITGDTSTGRLLGGQIVGVRSGEVAKRIDIFATALFCGLEVDQFSELDLSYTPPLGSPWDAVQVAAQAWMRHNQPRQNGEER